MPATSLLDLVKVYQILTAPSWEEELAQKVQEQKALADAEFAQKLQQNKSYFDEIFGGTGQGLPLLEDQPQGGPARLPGMVAPNAMDSGQQRPGENRPIPSYEDMLGGNLAETIHAGARLGLNPNFGSDLESVVWQNAIKAAMPANQRKPPRWRNVTTPPSGPPVGYDTEREVMDAMPTGPGYKPPQKSPLVQIGDISGGTLLAPPGERKMDEVLGQQAGDYASQLSNQLQSLTNIHKNSERLNTLLEGIDTTGFEGIQMKLESGIRAFFPNIRHSAGADESLANREAALVLSIQNAMNALQNFKGPTTDFEYEKAFSANPNLLMTPKGRRTALELLRKDLANVRQDFQDLVDARKNNTYGFGWIPPRIRREWDRILDDTPQKDGVPIGGQNPSGSPVEEPALDMYRMDPETGQYYKRVPKRR